MNYPKNCVIKAILLAVMVFLINSLSPVNGQEMKKFAVKGAREFGGSVSYQQMTPVVANSTAAALSIFSFMPYAGVFIYDNFEIGVNPVEVVAIKQLGSTTTQILFFAAPSYHFTIGNIIFPFIEAQIGIAYKTSNNVSEKGVSWGGRTGVKLALVNRGLLNLSLQYLRVTLNPKDVSGRYGFNQLLLSVGWTVWL